MKHRCRSDANTDSWSTATNEASMSQRREHRLMIDSDNWSIDVAATRTQTHDRQRQKKHRWSSNANRLMIDSDKWSIDEAATRTQTHDRQQQMKHRWSSDAKQTHDPQRQMKHRWSSDANTDSWSTATNEASMLQRRDCILVASGVAFKIKCILVAKVKLAIFSVVSILFMTYIYIAH